MVEGRKGASLKSKRKKVEEKKGKGWVGAIER